jgi:predicted nucleic acid-binding protein
MHYKPTVYLETTIIGYLAMRVSGVLRVAANQETTRDWWDNHRADYEVFVSRFVVDECADGDPEAARDRLSFLQDLELIQAPDEVETLAQALLDRVPLPEEAQFDALHIAVAAVNGIQYLLTWNCRHIANPALRTRIEAVCREMGFEPPVICTPQEILEIDDAI